MSAPHAVTPSDSREVPRGPYEADSGPIPRGPDHSRISPARVNDPLGDVLLVVGWLVFLAVLAVAAGRPS